MKAATQQTHNVATTSLQRRVVKTLCVLGKGRNDVDFFLLFLVNGLNKFEGVVSEYGYAVFPKDPCIGIFSFAIIALVNVRRQMGMI